MARTKHGVILKLSGVQKTLLFKRIYAPRRMILDETEYTILIDLEKLEFFFANEENEVLQENVIYKVNMNYLSHEAVDQEIFFHGFLLLTSNQRWPTTL